PVADRHELRHARGRLLFEQRDRVGPLGPRLPLGVARARKLLARGAAASFALGGRQMWYPRSLAGGGRPSLRGSRVRFLAHVRAGHCPITIHDPWVSGPHSPWVSGASRLGGAA